MGRVSKLFSKGQIVRSLAGRDKDSFLVVADVSSKGVMVVDGKHRPIERPKLKNFKHLSATKTVLNGEILETNRKVRHAINDFVRENI